jgi:hypothetical protein
MSKEKKKNRIKSLKNINGLARIERVSKTWKRLANSENTKIKSNLCEEKFKPWVAHLIKLPQRWTTRGKITKNQ